MTDKSTRWLGFLAALLLAWGSCDPTFAHAGSWQQPWVDALGLSAPFASGMVVLGVIGLSWAWWAARTASGACLLGSFSLWTLPLWLAPPILSSDLTLYADTGFILNSGGNPYLVGLGSYGGPLAPAVDPLWYGHGVAYPPLTLLINSWVISLTGAHPYWSLVALRLPVFIGVGLLWWSMARLANRFAAEPQSALWLGCANPLVLVHFIGGGHNDALMVGVAISALVVALEWHWLLGSILVGVAMLLKQQAGLAVLGVAGLPLVGLATWPLGQRLWRLGWRAAVSAVMAVLVFVGGSSATGLGFGWTHWLGEMGRTGTVAPFSLISQAAAWVGLWQGFSASSFIAGVSWISNITVVTLILFVVWRFHFRPLLAIGWGSLALAVFGQSLHPWYVVWGIACLALQLSGKQRMTQVWFIIVFIVWNAIQTTVWHSMPEWYAP